MTANTAAVGAGTPPSSFRRALALLEFAGRTVASGWAFRASSTYAWAAAVGYAALASAWAFRGEGVAGNALVARALVWISWAAGTAAWVAARNVEDQERRLGILTLAALRGASPNDYFVARVAATAVLLARMVALPGVLLAVAVTVLGRVTGGGAPSLTVFGGVIVYALMFGVVFGGVARLSSHVSPRHGRLVFVALVVGPEILRGVLGDGPSLISGFGELVDLLVGVGAA